MTDLILPFIPFVAAVAFFIRARGEEKARRHAEKVAGEAQQRITQLELYRAEWLATLSHELRTPLAAIVGYGELLEDGTLGPVDPRALDAIARIRLIADQILNLVDGVDRAAGGARVDAEDDPHTITADSLIDEAVEALRLDADSRQVGLTVQHTDVVLRTRPADAGRALELALSAAIKSSPGHPIQITADAASTPAIVIEHTRLDRLRDDPAWIVENTPHGESPHLTGPALRLGMARHIAEVSLHGQLKLTATPDGCVVRIELPRLD